MIRVWDSCVFISYLKMTDGVNEPGRTAEQLLGIEEMKGEHENGMFILAASVTTISEVLDTDLTPTAIKLFKDLFLRSDVVPINIDPPVAWLARELRIKFQGNKKKDPDVKGMKNPDSQILACAINSKVDEFYTFDGDKGYSFLKIASQIESEYGLKIRSPHKDLPKPPEPTLFTPPEEKPDGAEVDKPKEEIVKKSEINAESKNIPMVQTSEGTIPEAVKAAPKPVATALPDKEKADPINEVGKE